MARLFIDRGFNINKIDYVETALMLCVAKNDLEGAKFLLENGVSVNFSTLATFCFFYCLKFNDSILRLLTDYGADYNLTDKNKEVALHFLISGTSVHVEHGDDSVHIRRMFTRIVQKTDMTIVDKYNRTFLHCICKRYKNDSQGHAKALDLFKFIIALFLNARIPINAVDAKGNTAHDYAVKNNAYPICEFLRQKGGLSRDEIEVD